MTPTTAKKQAAEPTLTIGDLARRTGLTPAVLRMWESRHGFPIPQRLPSGHRRYAEEDVALVERVLRRRDAGIRLEVAITEAAASVAPGSPSVFAELRRKHPHLTPYNLRKSTLLALSWALEDEVCARADSPIIFGGFQTQAFYRPSIPRWRELARVARTTMAFADFPELVEQPEGKHPVLVPLGPDAPMVREWTVVCDAVDTGAVLSAWELPGQSEVPDRHRLFESVWSVEPQAVRDASRVCAQVAASAGVTSAAPILYELADEPPRRSVDPAASTALFNRIVAYVDRLGR